MQLSTIRYFYEVSRSQSIRAAADRLHIAPSAVSRQIAQLEEELGHPLFERRARGIRLTAAGEIAKEHFRRLLLNVDAVREQLGEMNALRRGILRIATVEGAVAHLLSSAIKDFHLSYPNIVFDITIAGTSAVVDAVLEGDADMFIAFNAPPIPEIRLVTQVVQPLHVAVGPEHPLRSVAAVSLSELADMPIGYLTEAHGIRTLLDSAFSRIGAVPRRTVISNSIEALKKFVQEGICITLMPPFAAQREVDAGLLYLVPVQDRDLCSASVTLGTHRDQEHSRPLQELVSRIERLLTRLPKASANARQIQNE